MRTRQKLRRDSVEVEAFNEEEAKKVAREQIPYNASITGTKIIQKGTKGFMGIGRKPHVYQIGYKLPVETRKGRLKAAKKVEGKPKKSQAAKTRTQARKLIKEIIYTVDLRQISHEIQQKRLDRLVDFGPEIIQLITNAVDSVVYESRAGVHFDHAGQLCAAIGRIGGRSAFDVLMKYFSFETNIWEYESIRAGAARGLGYLGDTRAIAHLTKALEKGSGTDQVYSAIRESLERLGSKPPLTAYSLMERFVETELLKKEPDFKGFSTSLRRFPKAHRAGAWWNLGWALKRKGDEEKAQKCFVKSLTINASPDNAAWIALRPPIDEEDKRNARTLKKLKQKIGVIVE